jgi:uncharacterized RDD family membrane protein YckC
MSRVIRNRRAVELQGRRAGFVTRAIASGLDIGVAFAIFVVVVVVIEVVWDLFFSERVQVSPPHSGLSATLLWLTTAVYLAVGWGSTGRSIGKQVMGVRVVRRDATPLKPAQAFGRALLCASFYPVLLLALFHRRNAGVEDIVCRTVVVYDWIPADATRHMPAHATAGAAASGQAGA